MCVHFPSIGGAIPSVTCSSFWQTADGRNFGFSLLSGPPLPSSTDHVPVGTMGLELKPSCSSRHARYNARLVVNFQAGAYILNLYDWQSGGVSLLFLAFFEAITISWGYGADRFARDIKVMIGKKIWPWWPFAWKYCSPAVILGKANALVLSCHCPSSVMQGWFLTYMLT